jgi:iron complex outermembrane recepter protein
MRTTILMSIVTVSAFGIMATTPVWAQSADADAQDEAKEARGSGEIVVTARRRDERLIDVPIAVQAIDGDDLATKGVQRMDDLMVTTPSLKVTPTAGRRSNSQYELRGISASESLITQDPAVGVYVNEVYLARATGTNQSFFDIENVQVLYGPQGTLFGRNSPGGAILVNTKQPTDKFEAEANAGYGNYNRLELGGMVNVPLAEGVALRLAGKHSQHDGYGFDITNNREIADENVVALRGSLGIEIGNIKNVTVANYFRSKDNGSLNALVAAVPCVPNPTQAGLNQILRGNPPASCLFSPTVNAVLGRGDVFAQVVAQNARGPYRVAYDAGLLTYDKARTISLSNNTSIELSDNLTFKNIFGYHQVKYLTLTDLDGSPIKIIDTFLDSRVKQFTDEVQLQGSFDNLEFTVGGMYFRERGRDIQLSTQLQGFNPNNPSLLNTVGINKSYAVFAQATYKLTERLSLTAGGRYTWDKRTAIFDKPTTRFGTATPACQFPVIPGILTDTSLATGCVITQKRSYSDPSYNISLDYKPSDDVLLYAAHRRGYRSGGFSARAVSVVQLTPFEPETVTDFELGLKANFDLGTVPARFNVAASRSKYDNIQKSVAFDPDGPGPLVQTTNIINAAKATIKGFEVEAGFSPVKGFDINARWGYIDGTYNDFVSDFTNANPAFQPSAANPLQCGTTVVTTGGTIACDGVDFGVPKSTWGIDIALTPIDTAEFGTLTFSGSYTHRGSWFGLLTLPILEDFANVPSEHNVNLSIDWREIAGSKFSAQFWVRNATNEDKVLANLSLGRTLGIADYTYGDPRTYGLTLRYKFGN